MELVYLWIEDYKNIHRQGFNFSPRFECRYDENTRELTIDEKKDYVNIFPENINITAIVGENGSGKSSILKSIVSKQRIFIIVLDEELKIYTKNVHINTSLQRKHLSSSFLRDVLYYSMDDTYLRQTNPMINHIELENTNRLITENYSKLNSLALNIFKFKPAYIYYELNDFNLIGEDFGLDDSYVSDIKSALGWDLNADSGVILDTIKALRAIDDEYMNYLLYQFGNRSFLFEKINLTEKLHPKHLYLMLEKDELQGILKGCKLPFLSESEFKLLIDNQSKKIKIEELETLFGENYIDLLYISMQDEIEFNYFSENGASFNSLSHGEKTIYSFVVNLVNYNKEEFLFILDEPDNTLHPDWQKKFLNELIEIINKLGKKAHIIITTHSPFLLSDLPKENVIFLEKNEKGNCKNSTKETKIETFGANIHTLLAHGFFMKDGLMGEFAKDKIQSIIKYHEEILEKELTKEENKEQKDEEKEIYEKEHKTKFWQIQSIIGDDYLKQVIKNHLIEIEKIVLGNDKAKQEEIKRLKAKIELLEK